MIVLVALLGAFGAFLTAYVLYQTMLYTANAVIPEAPRGAASLTRRFVVLIPAHNEELHLSRLLSTLAAQHYPKDRVHVVVIADNCTDATAQVARSANVSVLERADTARTGKGHAIGWALERIDLARFDALAIVDGDSLVDPRCLHELNLQMECGDRVIQCSNGVANPGQTWFTRLMDVSRTIANEIIHPGKRKLGLSSHLMGNGMCFDARVLATLGWNAFSIGEDWEYYVRLVLDGSYIGFCRHARVYHQESVNLQQASSQRLRWSSSRFDVLRRFGPPLLAEGIRARSIVCIDAALPLLFPNPSLGISLTLGGLALAAVYGLLGGGLGLVAWYSALALVQLVMFLLGVLYTKDPKANALSLFLAPVFLGWKLGIDVLSICGFGAKQWKATERRL